MKEKCSKCGKDLSESKRQYYSFSLEMWFCSEKCKNEYVKKIYGNKGEECQLVKTA